MTSSGLLKSTRLHEMTIKQVTINTDNMAVLEPNVVFDGQTSDNAWMRVEVKIFFMI